MYRITESLFSKLITTKIQQFLQQWNTGWLMLETKYTVNAVK